MRPIVSDSTGAGVVTVDWLAQGSVSAPALFQSRVRDTSDDRVIWDAVTTTPGDVAIETAARAISRSADGTWSAWEPTGAAGAIVSPRGRYIQYRATLTNDDPILDRVEITYAIDDDPPMAVIAGVQVTGDDASVTFSSPDSDVAGFVRSSTEGFAACAAATRSAAWTRARTR